MREELPPEHEHRREQDRSAPEPVAEISHDRRADELDDRVLEHQPTAVHRRLAQLLSREFHDQLGGDRNDDAEPRRIEERGHEDEGEGLARLAWHRF